MLLPYKSFLTSFLQIIMLLMIVDGTELIFSCQQYGMQQFMGNAVVKCNGNTWVPKIPKCITLDPLNENGWQ